MVVEAARGARSGGDVVVVGVGAWGRVGVGTRATACGRLAVQRPLASSRRSTPVAGSRWVATSGSDAVAVSPDGKSAYVVDDDESSRYKRCAGESLINDHSFSVGASSSYLGTSASWETTVSNFSTTDSAFEVTAVCGSPLPHYAIPSKSASDPAGVQKGIVKDCKAPAVVLGGGNKSSNTTNLRIGMKATQPFPASGAGWKSGENNDTAAGTTLTSYAICAT